MLTYISGDIGIIVLAVISHDIQRLLFLILLSRRIKATWLDIARTVTVLLFSNRWVIYSYVLSYG